MYQNNYIYYCVLTLKRDFKKAFDSMSFQYGGKKSLYVQISEGRQQRNWCDVTFLKRNIAELGTKGPPTFI